MFVTYISIYKFIHFTLTHTSPYISLTTINIYTISYIHLTSISICISISIIIYINLSYPRRPASPLVNTVTLSRGRRKEVLVQGRQ